jgi:hypothetical protein
VSCSATQAPREDLDALLANTNIEEMKKMFAFLHALHEASTGRNASFCTAAPASDGSTESY